MVSGDVLPQQPNEVLIDGILYDCTNFRHPGGSILKYFLGSGDATETYQQFHFKLPRADKYLKRLPNRPAPPRLHIGAAEQRRLAKLSRDFKALQEACVKEAFSMQTGRTSSTAFRS
ncbi:hypothetical protein LSCM1_07379 [Leishmania martiniquensis]|uniref:Cytochrome b5 heme-binding domain-containing protein n=1 Tax=Leishmania martiniquensis TaxID=1580590 RepID=A0A836H3L9_9TRYP|nr:hypothetical protein LSCM1_07379 [Leishmania martiniquensis]